jgi:hypothetical protein
MVGSMKSDRKKPLGNKGEANPKSIREFSGEAESCATI